MSSPQLHPRQQVGRAARVRVEEALAARAQQHDHPHGDAAGVQRVDEAERVFGRARLLEPRQEAGVTALQAHVDSAEAERGVLGVLRGAPPSAPCVHEGVAARRRLRETRAPPLRSRAAAGRWTRRARSRRRGRSEPPRDRAPSRRTTLALPRGVRRTPASSPRGRACRETGGRNAQAFQEQPSVAWRTSARYWSGGRMPTPAGVDGGEPRGVAAQGIRLAAGDDPSQAAGGLAGERITRRRRFRRGQGGGRARRARTGRGLPLSSPTRPGAGEELLARGRLLQQPAVERAARRQVAAHEHERLAGQVVGRDVRLADGEHGGVGPQRRPWPRGRRRSVTWSRLISAPSSRPSAAGSPNVPRCGPAGHGAVRSLLAGPRRRHRARRRRRCPGSRPLVPAHAPRQHAPPELLTVRAARAARALRSNPGDRRRGMARYKIAWSAR